MTPLKTRQHKRQVLEMGDFQLNMDTVGKTAAFGLFPTPLPGGETANVLKPYSISVFTLGPGKVQRRVWLN